MKYVRTPGFLIDLRRLPDEHRKPFRPCMRFSVWRWTLVPIRARCRGRGRCAFIGSA